MDHSITSSLHVALPPDFSVRRTELGALPLAAPCASLSTASLLMTEEPNVHIPMFAPYVELQLMAHRRVLLEVLFPVSTSLIVDRWKSSLQDAGVLDLFAEVLKGLHSGFDIGIDSLTLDCFFSPPNHFRSSEA